ncbi:hypothetical protein DUI87_15220 [Hirundo rustica rustica]|uniref:Uncharacterized protein n=1 Tax=Hirundo rustica rustica TaxID=333673 RepID=A0A3M0K4M8_HIRRU|nr:hypothetical protein DUI87_15220 [Hirundo rustica rustica]
MEEEAVEEEEEHLLPPSPSCTLGGCRPKGAVRELIPGKAVAMAQAKPLAKPCQGGAPGQGCPGGDEE